MIVQKQTIAIVDANATHRKEAKAVLDIFYNVLDFENGREAIRALKRQSLINQPASLILAGLRVEPSGTINFIKSLRQERALVDIPVIQLLDKPDNYMLIAAGKEAGSSDFLAKPYKGKALLEIISKHLKANAKKEWEGLNETPRIALQNSAKIFESLNSVIASGETIAFQSVKDSCAPLVDAVENNDFKCILNGVRDYDDYTYAHSMRVATLLSLLGHAAGFKNDEQLLLASGGLMHDVGKMMIPHEVLNKPGRLTEAEFEIMKSHVPETIKYLKLQENIPKAIFIIAEQHHEKLDGTGYPHNLAGKHLNELARMAAVVDVYSALTDRRVYKPEMEAAKAMSIMEDEMGGSHLDKKYIAMFKDILIDADILQKGI